MLAIESQQVIYLRTLKIAVSKALIVPFGVAEGYGIFCFHKPVLIGNCRDDLLHR